MNSSLQTVNRSPDHFELSAIVGFDRRCSLRLQFPYARFDRRLVDADDGVMLVLDTQSLGERNDEVLFIQLGITLHSLMLAALSHFA
jgi:hypothetical protein